ncbi:HU family DNA-binding protein [Bacillus sp. AG4(2022)]|uniref:HU family DNA-binding protein n=1 Tax=Bacillus sp. AG4(2022) TaxID=2962594 RepID=UPI002881F2AC|nr:HU family DNA-binding protein [Bacillus sp. AG4(2022)]MDT0160290.1 HU family DNA-binding protein [Bacillus sp. AG4(2022)]
MAANKTDLVNAVQELLASQEVEFNKKDSTKLVDAVIDSIIGLTGETGKLQLVGFGTFEVKERAARLGRNPQSGQEIQIEAKRVPTFKSGKAFKDFVK